MTCDYDFIMIIFVENIYITIRNVIIFEKEFYFKNISNRLLLYLFLLYFLA